MWDKNEKCCLPMDNGSEDPIIDRLSFLSKTLFEKNITEKQKKVIQNLVINKTFSQNIKLIRKNTNISEPSIRRTIQLLRKLEMIECGSRENIGMPIRFTVIGKIVLGGHSIMAVHRAPDSEVGVQFPLTPYKKEIIQYINK